MEFFLLKINYLVAIIWEDFEICFGPLPKSRRRINKENKTRIRQTNKKIPAHCMNMKWWWLTLSILSRLRPCWFSQRRRNLHADRYSIGLRVYIQNCLGYNVTGQRNTPIRQPRSINHSRKDPLYTYTKSIKIGNDVYCITF